MALPGDALLMLRDRLRGADREHVRLVALLTSGHAVIHWHQQLYPVVIPTIKSALGLDDVQVGRRPGCASSLFTQVFVLLAPVIAGAMIAPFGIAAPFALSRVLMLLGGSVLLALPLRRRSGL